MKIASYIGLSLAILIISSNLHAEAGTERCSRHDGYLEALLATADARKIEGVCLTQNGSGHPGVDFRHLDHLCNHLQLPTACVLESMKKASRTGNGDYSYVRCTADRSGVDTRPFLRPCISEKYHFAAYSGFINSMTCLGLDAKELFPLINHESHFHMNIRSGTGALGVGQLTGEAIDEVNRQQTLELLRGDGRCAALKTSLERPMSALNGCQRVSPPQNPNRNFLYAGAAYRFCKAKAVDLVARLPLFARIPQSWQDTAAIDLARWMYNGGIEGISTVLQGFAKRHPDGLSDYSQFRKGFQDYLADNYGKSISAFGSAPARRRTEVSGYLNGIGNDLIEVENNFPEVQCANY